MRTRFPIILFILISTPVFAQQVLDYKLLDIWNGSKWELGGKESYLYDNNDSIVGRLYENWNSISTSFSNQHRQRSIFNSQGQKVKITDAFWYGDSIGWKNGFKDENYYSSDGNLIEKIFYIWEFEKWYPKHRYLYGYGSKKELLFITYQHWNRSSQQWIPSLNKYSLTYGSNGNLIEAGDSNQRYFYQYNAQNQLDSSYSENKSGDKWVLSFSSSYMYNSFKKLSNKLTSAWKGILPIEIRKYQEFLYYNTDSLIKEKIWQQSNTPIIYTNKNRYRYFYKKSFSQIPFGGALLIFPQPATTTLNFVNNVNGVSYKIFNMQGSEILGGNLLSGVNVFDVSTFPRGTYVLEVYGTSNVWSEKILISP